VHRLLARQLKKHLPPGVDPATLHALLHAVSEAYQSADADRLLLERSIELASHELHERNHQLEDDLRQRRRLELELRQGEKLRAVGQLAAGIAHEINTPVQFVGDSIHFLRQTFADLRRLLDEYSALCAAVEAGEDARALLGAVRQLESEVDLDEFRDDAKLAFERIDEGVSRVTEIVRAMKEFGHTDQREIVQVDLNRGVSNTLIVARNEIKYVADVELDLAELPLVAGNPNELNQVFLILIVNAAHAIAERCGPEPRRGKITIRSVATADDVVISIADDGAGIPADVVHRVFEPFFTTKEVGRGTGQGLPIARSIIVDKHNGSLTFTTEPGVGTTFFVRIPLRPRRVTLRSEEDVVESATALRRDVPPSAAPPARAEDGHCSSP
jgi:signal transduction histidine kinase